MRDEGGRDKLTPQALFIRAAKPQEGFPRIIEERPYVGFNRFSKGTGASWGIMDSGSVLRTARNDGIGVRIPAQRFAELATRNGVAGMTVVGRSRLSRSRHTAFSGVRDDDWRRFYSDGFESRHSVSPLHVVVYLVQMLLRWNAG